MPRDGARSGGRGARGRARVIRVTLLVIAFATGIVAVLRSLGGPAVPARFERAELEREAAATRAATVAARAAEARAATKPALARAQSLRSRVTVVRTGELRVQDTAASEAMLVSVPPLVTERMQADSAAISALSLALTWDTRAAVAQEERLAVESKAHDVARLTITQLEHERKPRCGRRCGMVLGAAGIVALGIAVDQTRRLLYH